MPDSKSGWDALLGIANEFMDLIESGNNRVILAGDFNLWPNDVLPIVQNNMGLVDLMGSVDGLPKLVGGGIDDYPDAWEMSDHSPVVVEFNRMYQNSEY